MSDVWLDVMQRVYGRAAHELKGALNGVSVNLEVVRSRSERPDTPASAVSTFARAAASQLDVVISLSDALLVLGRTAREPVDIGVTVRHLATVLAAAARADGRRLELDAGVSVLGPSSASGNAVRAAIGACMMATIDCSTDVRCSASADGSSLLMTTCDAVTPVVDAGVAAAAGDAGIRVELDPEIPYTLSITFPR